MPRLATAERESRRTRILNAALRCFARKGLHLTTMDEIAAEAGISKGAPYVYFESKLALFSALQDLWDCGLERRVDRALSDLAPDERRSPRRALESVVRAVGDHVREEGDLCRVLMDARAQSAYVAGLGDRVQAGMATQQARMASLVRAAVAVGELPAGTDPELRARLILATIHGLMADWHLSPGGFSWKEAAAEVARIHLCGD